MLVFVYLLLLPLASGLSAGACDCVGGENFNVNGWNGAAAAGADAALAGSISAAVLPGACLNATLAECDDPSSAINGAPECEPAVLDDFVASISSGSIENCSGSLFMFEWLSALAQQCQSTGAFITSQGMRRLLCSPTTPFFDLDAPDTAAGILFLGTSYGLPIDAWQGFYTADIAGWHWASLLPKDYEDLGFTKGEAYVAYEGAQGTVEKFGEPGEYAWPGLDEKLGPTIITPQIVLQRLIDVRSPEYFEVEYLVTLSWYDRRIFSECNGTVKSTEAKNPGRKVDSCDIYWRPELQLPNALDGEVTLVEDSGLTTIVGADWDSEYTERVAPPRSLALLSYRQRAKFMAVIDERELPYDTHTLDFVVAMPDVLASEACFQVGGPRETVLVDLPASQLGSSWGRTGDPVKVWRGDDLQVRKSGRVGNPIWDIIDFTAEAVVMPTTLGSVAAMATSDWATANNPSFQYRTLLEAQGFDFDQQDSDPTRSTCALRLSITIDRRMNYHMWNFMIMQFVLVLLGMCTFAVDPSAIDARLGLAFTMVLAINVFQILLVENLPEMGDLSRLQWFTIMNTIVLGLMAVESVVVCNCSIEYNALLDTQRRLKQYVNDADAILCAVRLQRAARRRQLRRASSFSSFSSSSSAAAEGDVEAGAEPSLVLRTRAAVERAEADEENPSRVTLYVLKRKLERLRMRCVAGIAVWGDLVSAVIIFPVLLALATGLSLGGVLDNLRSEA